MSSHRYPRSMATTGNPSEWATGDPLHAHPDVLPLDEVCLSPQDRASIRTGREDVEAGRTTTLEELQVNFPQCH